MSGVRPFIRSSVLVNLDYAPYSDNYKSESDDIWTILYIITICVLGLLCCRAGHVGSFSIDVTLLSPE